MNKPNYCEDTKRTEWPTCRGWIGPRDLRGRERAKMSIREKSDITEKHRQLRWSSVSCVGLKWLADQSICWSTENEWPTTYQVNHLWSKNTKYSLDPAAQIWRLVSFLCKLNVVVLNWWSNKKMQFKRGHLGLWDIVMDIIQYFLIRFSLNY